MPLKETTHLRPIIHFTPTKNWMNDPNGMFYFNGYYHLFFQYNPTGDVWGNMHWGHAISNDLIHWQEQEIGLFAEPEKLGYIFSGGAVVDHNNSSGFQQGELSPIVASFTNQTQAEVQHQSLAYSTDGGNHWQMFDHNPVIENPGVKDFRDPKVFWHDETNQWIKSLAVGQCIQFFSSKDLKSWCYLSEFGQGFGCHRGVWECPDLFPLEDQQGNVKWVLLVSLSPGGPNGGSATQYFVGDFDGVRFSSEQVNTAWLDHGPDNYAGVTWDNIPDTDNRRIFIGWMSNWLYAKDVPTSPWRSSMTLPRELSLIKAQTSWHVASYPVDELRSNREPVKGLQPGENRNFTIINKEAIDIELELHSNYSQKTELLRLTNAKSESLTIALDLTDNEITIERGNSGWSHTEFRKSIKVPIPKTSSDTNHCRIIIDNGSIELFWQRGQVCATTSCFPSESFNTLVIVPDAKAKLIKQCDVYSIC